MFAVGAVTVISPLELVRTKMQSRRRPYRELFACIRSAVAQDGVLSLWRGWGPTVLRDVPFSGENYSTTKLHKLCVKLSVLLMCVFSALYWFNYELVKAQLCQWSQLTQANFSISFAAGAFSGGVSSQMLASRFRRLAIVVTPTTPSLQIAAVLTLPFDVVKTRRQIQLGEMDSLGGLTTILHGLTKFPEISFFVFLLHLFTPQGL